MKKIPPFLLVIVFVLPACGAPTPTTSVNSPTPAFNDLPVQTNTPVLTIPPDAPAVSAALDDRPVFLAWPLPAYIGIVRISQYPNTPWTWNYLGLNEGYQCPPMFGYLLNLDSLQYWRDVSIPEEQDKAQADPHNFEMVECYSTDENVGANGHEGTDIKAPAGTPVYAVADGKIQEWRLTGLNSMIVLKHCLSGTWDGNDQCTGGKQWYTTYMHIVTNKELLTENLAVPQGTQVGTIYDQTINSHLHFEVGLDKRSYTNFVNPWGNNETPWLGCLWLDRSLCPYPDLNSKRIAFYTNTGELTIRQGEMNVNIRNVRDVKQMRLWGDRIVLLDSRGDLILRDGTYNVNEDSVLDWSLFSNFALDFQITEQRAAILDASGILFVNESNRNLEWKSQAQHVRAFSLSDHRLGYLADNGDLFVKEGGLDAEWTLVAQNVFAFQLNDNRIAIADQQGNLFVNEGKLFSEWEHMADSVKAFQLTSVRMGIIDADDNLLVKEGNLRAEWVALAGNVRSFQLANDRVLMLDEDEVLKLKEGNLYEDWSALPYTDLKFAFLNGGTPVFIP
jgi:murein DD-endopeptidase MepM/ murein hydrolase activator NlpD